MDRLNEIRTRLNNLLNESLKEEYTYINEIIKDDDCFFKMNIDMALDILKRLGYDNGLEVYEELIDAKNFKDDLYIVYD